jgi:hypothetical protein
LINIQVRKYFQSIINSKIFPLLLTFLLVNIICRGTGGTNELSRLTTMRAMSQEQTFSINKYENWTVDWAITPDGKKYSNKAPGPMLLGLPVFWAIELFTQFDKKVERDNEGNRIELPGATTKTILSLLMQVLPFLGILFLIFNQSQYLFKGTTPFWLIALLFGQTNSIYMNSYFGHGLASIMFLSMIFSLRNKNIKLVGLFFGLSLLCDYGVGILLIPLLIYIYFTMEKKFNWISDFIIGGILPGVLWVWYHTVSFGGPFSFPFTDEFQNPAFHDVKEAGGNLWGVFHLNFKWNILYELLFGAKRGLLFTQPWLLFCIPILLLNILKTKVKEIKYLNSFALTGFFILLIMNTNFGGWHGGWAPGPRYMSLIFPLIAISFGEIFQDLGKKTKTFFWITLIITVFYYLMTYAGTHLIPDDQLPWSFQYVAILNSNKILIKLLLISCITIVGSIKTYNRMKA